MDNPFFTLEERAGGRRVLKDIFEKAARPRPSSRDGEVPTPDSSKLFGHEEEPQAAK